MTGADATLTGGTGATAIVTGGTGATGIVTGGTDDRTGAAGTTGTAGATGAFTGAIARTGAAAFSTVVNTGLATAPIIWAPLVVAVGSIGAIGAAEVPTRSPPNGAAAEALPADRVKPR